MKEHEMTYDEARKLMEDEGCTCSISGIRDRRGHAGSCPSQQPERPIYSTASYTYEPGTSRAGETVTGRVVEQGRNFADVIWPDGTTDRVNFAEKAVTFA